MSEQFPESLERSQQRRKNQLIFWKYFFCDETRKVCEIDIDPLINIKSNIKQFFSHFPKIKTSFSIKTPSIEIPSKYPHHPEFPRPLPSQPELDYTQSSPSSLAELSSSTSTSFSHFINGATFL